MTGEGPYRSKSLERYSRKEHSELETNRQFTTRIVIYYRAQKYTEPTFIVYAHRKCGRWYAKDIHFGKVETGVRLL